jgi:hypothetical protein
MTEIPADIFRKGRVVDVYESEDGCLEAEVALDDVFDEDHVRARIKGGSNSQATGHIVYTLDLVDDPNTPIFMPAPGRIVSAYAGVKQAPTSTASFKVRIDGALALSPTVGSGNRVGATVRGTHSFRHADAITVEVDDAADAGGPATIVIGYTGTGRVGTGTRAPGEGEMVKLRKPGLRGGGHGRWELE